MKTISNAIALGSDGKSMFALRDDGAVFVFIRRGDFVRGVPAEDPTWLLCPPVPGTVAAAEAEG